jgi:hypothetical protein
VNETLKAPDVYEAEVVRLGRLTRARNWIITLAVASGGESTVPPWSHKVRIIDRATKQVVREVSNATADTFDLVAEAEQNLEEFSVEQFEEAWGLSTRSSSQLRPAPRGRTRRRGSCAR